MQRRNPQIILQPRISIFFVVKENHNIHGSEAQADYVVMTERNPYDNDSFSYAILCSKYNGFLHLSLVKDVVLDC